MKSIDELLDNGSDEEKKAALENWEQKLFELEAKGFLARATDLRLDNECLRLERDIINLRSDIVLGEAMAMQRMFTEALTKKESAIRATDAKYIQQRKSRKHCYERAALLWAAETGEITRIGEMATNLYCELVEKDMYYPEDAKGVRDWLKKAERNGKLSIPEAAKKPGRKANN